MGKLVSFSLFFSSKGVYETTKKFLKNRPIIWTVLFLFWLGCTDSGEVVV